MTTVDAAVGGEPKTSLGHAHSAIELLVEVLANTDVELDRAGFYSRLADVVCRTGDLQLAVIFRFDEVTRRVEAAGAHGIELDRFAGMPVTLDTAPDAARALIEDRIIEARWPAAHPIPAGCEELIGDRPLVYVPIAAGGRWPGVIIAVPKPGSPPLDDARRELLWTVGKTLALASMARIATFHGERARELEERIDLAREIHDRAMQRLFGVSMALSLPGTLDDSARERCANEVQIALGDLRSALRRPLGRPARPTGTTVAAELARLSVRHPELDLRVEGPVPEIPVELEPLLQSVLAEALRNARKHANGGAAVVRVRRQDRLLVLEVENDGVGPHSRPDRPGVGLRLAAFEALRAGGTLEFGEREPGRWQVHLAVPVRGR